MLNVYHILITLDELFGCKHKEAFTTQKASKMHQSFFSRYPTNNSICYFFFRDRLPSKTCCGWKKKNKWQNFRIHNINLHDTCFFRMHHKYRETLSKVAFLYLFFHILSKHFISFLCFDYSTDILDKILWNSCCYRSVKKSPLT